MNDFSEAADNFRTAQLQKLLTELQQEKEAHCCMRELAVDRGERIIELTRVANDLKDERDKLLADSKRLAFIVEQQAVVQELRTGGKFCLVYRDGYTQVGVYNSPIEAIDAAMEGENV